MSRRLTLDELRPLVLDELDGDWVTPSVVVDRLGLGHGIPYYQAALVLERLAHEGVAELENAASRGKRRFRRRHQDARATK